MAIWHVAIICFRCNIWKRISYTFVFWPFISHSSTKQQIFILSRNRCKHFMGNSMHFLLCPAADAGYWNCLCFASNTKLNHLRHTLIERIYTFIMRKRMFRTNKSVYLGQSFTFCPPHNNRGQPHISLRGQNIGDWWLGWVQDRGGQGQLRGRVRDHPPQGGLRRQPRTCQGDL